MKVGEAVKINGIDAVILDIQNDEVFMWTRTDDFVQFSNRDNNYKGSILEKKCNDWVEKMNLPFIERKIDLTTLSGNRDYGSIKAKVAPLTFDEYRKYTQILEPHIQQCFWLATGWFKNYYNSTDANFACFVCSNGRLGIYNYINDISTFAPAFKLPLSYFDTQNVSNISTDILIAELVKRFAHTDLVKKHM